MQFGFAKVDITPRVGVELCGFGPYVLRRSIGIRDRLWARAMAVRAEAGQTAVLVSCDLVGVTRQMVSEARALVAKAVGIGPEAVMIHCTHTHSGPGIGSYIGWGEADTPYLELLPRRLARACLEALVRLEEATLAHAVVPCEGIGINRENEAEPKPWDVVLQESWRPQKPELTDTRCQVLKIEAAGRLLGFLSYFGCHPVVCCAETRYIHGDYCGVATNLIERENPGAVGLFLQGAEGDVNTCVVHKPEPDSLLALDVIAARYARSVRAGLAAARPVAVERLATARREVVFSRKPWGREKLAALLRDEEAILHAEDARDTDGKFRLAVVRAEALRRMIATLDAGGSLEPAVEVHGLRLGPVALLGAPFEIFQAVRNDIVRQARAGVPLVLSQTNDSIGYAVDHAKAASGGYAADLVPLIIASLPFAAVHDELVRALLAVDGELAADRRQDS